MNKDKNGYRILVIEDNPGDFTLIKDFLEEQVVAPEITQAKNFAAAQLLLNDAVNKYDVILLDLTLPDKSGELLISEINLLRPACPVIVLTGYIDIEFSIRSLSLGMADYLLKEDITATSLYKSIVYNIERKKTNDRLKESEKRYSDLFHLSPQPMWVFEPETFKFVTVNEAAMKNYGYSYEEFLQMTILDIRPEEQVVHLKEKLAGHDDISHGHFRHRKKNNDIIEVEIYSNPIKLNGQNYRFVIAIDVTEKIAFDHKITRAIIKTQEDERYEIGGELHDNVCQILASSQMSLGMLKKSLLPASMTWYDQCRQYIILATDEIRNLSHRLAPAFFKESNIKESFEILLKSCNLENKFTIHLFIDKFVKEYDMPVDLHLNLYRILQEQMRNICKYSKAGEVEVDMGICEEILKMRIADNGVGFDVNIHKEGIGLANMKRRAELFSGSLIINSSPGNGCEITIAIPLQMIANDK